VLVSINQAQKRRFNCLPQRIAISNLAFIVPSIIQKASNALEVLKEVLDAVDSQNPEVLFSPAILNLVFQYFRLLVSINCIFISHDPTIRTGSTSLFDFLCELVPLNTKARESSMALKNFESH
jgi:hypothetical protein